MHIKTKAMDNYFSLSIQTVALQTLETVYIILTTKNLDTLKGRHGLLLERIATLRNAESNRLFLGDVNAAIETYKSMYYDRPLKDVQLAAILKPNGFDVQGLYCEALINCIKRFVEGQQIEISKLKSEQAKIKRRAKVIGIIQLTKAELQSECATTASYLISLNSIAEIQATLS